MNLRIKIKHPEWLVHSHPEKSIRLIREGRMPQSIAGWMLVTSLKHPLRAVYGSDLKAAWALLISATKEAISGRIDDVLYRLKIKQLPDMDEFESEGRD